MNLPNQESSWEKANQRYLMNALGLVREALEAKGKEIASSNPEFSGENREYLSSEFTDSATQNSRPPALENVCQAFGLSPFERDLLLLCAGMELYHEWGAMCASAQGDAQQNYPTFSLALAILPASNWAMLTPNSPLRRWQLIEVGASKALTLSPLRIDEQILHYLLGVAHLDERLGGILEPLSAKGHLVPSHQRMVEQMSETWWQASNQVAVLPILQLCGGDVASKRAIATTVCHQVGLNLYKITAEGIPTDNVGLNLVKCLCEREYYLRSVALLLECDDLETTDPARESAIARFAESANIPLIISSRDRRRQRQRPLITLEVRPPTSAEQRTIWQNTLGETAHNLNGHIETLISHFSLSPAIIHAACLQVRGIANAEDSASENLQSKIQNRLWDTCRSQARPRLDDLAQRIESSASWDDLVLPEKERQVLRDISAHLRQRGKVYENWGFAGKSQRGLGISALFAGSSGTGKTMAAEVLAEELRLDIYRIDLSAVVSKYIGETEKNLGRVFDAAEVGGVILLFDEADALFGKRSEVKDSHDRYANMEVSYLLQRMESYRGLSILTTNLKGSIDQAFLRRIRFIVQFPFPDSTQRAEIWRRVFPKTTPTVGLDVERLAKLNVAGGNIRNIALNAAFLAAEAGESVEMKHILKSTKSEYMKLERTLTDIEIRGWV